MGSWDSDHRPPLPAAYRHSKSLQSAGCIASSRTNGKPPSALSVIPDSPPDSEHDSASGLYRPCARSLSHSVAATPPPQRRVSGGGVAATFS
jgi:hypothetical protein